MMTVVPSRRVAIVATDATRAMPLVVAVVVDVPELVVVSLVVVVLVVVELVVGGHPTVLFENTAADLPAKLPSSNPHAP